MKKINILALLLLFSAAAVRAQDDIPADTEVKKTDSGLEYCVLEAGDGKASPKFGDTVKAHYTGWLASDGKKFDSSYDRGETPLEFRLGNVIEGWNEGLTLMSKGAKFKLKIPSALGYGERGTGGIPPGSDLVFVVQLVDFSEGPELPTKPDFSSGTTSELDGGLKHQVVKAGEGDSAADSDIIELAYGYWNKESGQMIGASVLAGNQIKLRKNDSMFPFFIRLCELGLQKGSTHIFEVPPEMLFGKTDRGSRCPPNTTTLWTVEVTGITLMPKFSMPADDKLTTTESGLKYMVMKEGKEDGKTPTASGRVQVHYSGWLTDGTGFDSSYERGSPATFGVGQVIKGWTEGLQLMKEGSVYKLVIPAGIGYGANGSPPKIPGGATLVFQVELLKVL